MQLIKTIFGIAVFAIFTSTALAQPVSPLNEGTDGLFGNDTDNTMSLNGWVGVDFDKFLVTGTYGYLGASASNSAHTVLKTHVLNGAGMFKLGGITLSVSYLGTLGGSSDAELKLLETETKAENPHVTVNNTVPLLHNIRVLVGIPLGALNLGVRAGLDIGGSTTTQTGPGATLDDIKKFSNKNSMSFKPQLAVGTKIGMGNGYVLSPSLDMNVAITNSSGAGQSVYPGEETGPTKASDGSIYESRKTMRTYIPEGILGLGIDFPQNGSVALSANVSYGFSVGIQPEKSEYQRLYDGSSKTDEISEHIMKSNVTQGHDVILKFAGKMAVTEKLQLAGRIQLNTLYDYVLDGGTTKISGTEFRGVKTSESSTMFLQPVISAGATYQFTDTLSWYGGMKFVPVAYTYQTISRYAEYGIEFANDPDMSETSHTLTYPYLAAFGTGLEFKPAQELAVSFGLLFAPSDITELNTVSAVLNNANLRLGLVWKDVAKN